MNDDLEDDSDHPQARAEKPGREKDTMARLADKLGDGDTIGRAKLQPMLKRNTAVKHMIGAAREQGDAETAPAKKPAFLNTAEYDLALELAGAKPPQPEDADAADEVAGEPAVAEESRAREEVFEDGDEPPASRPPSKSVSSRAVIIGVAAVAVIGIFSLAWARSALRGNSPATRSTSATADAARAARPTSDAASQSPRAAPTDGVEPTAVEPTASAATEPEPDASSDAPATTGRSSERAPAPPAPPPSAIPKSTSAPAPSTPTTSAAPSASHRLPFSVQGHD